MFMRAEQPTSAKRTQGSTNLDRFGLFGSGQHAFDGFILIMTHVLNAILAVAPEGGNVGLIPAALGHMGREADQEAKTRQREVRRHQHGGREPVISFDDGKRPGAVDADQKN